MLTMNSTPLNTHFKCLNIEERDSDVGYVVFTQQGKGKIVNREFKKLRRLLQRERHIKIELCVRLSVMRLFQVGHVVQTKRSVLSLAWHEWFSCKGRE